MADLKTLSTIDTSPFKRLVLNLGATPTAFSEGMTYYELLAWLVKYLEEEVVPKTNENIEAVKELQSYVSTYFDNLDVQEEINNKLDQMAEDGTLQAIIESYINLNALIVYETLADLKASEALISGMTVRTLGYHTKGDGGSAIYRIREVTNQDTENDMDIVAITNDENLVAEFILTDLEIYPEKFGAYGNGTNDDTTSVNFAINYAITKNLPVCLNNQYLINNTINISTHSLTVKGNRNKKNVQNLTNNYSIIWNGEGYLFNINADTSGFKLENISIKGTALNSGIYDKGFRNTYHNVTLYNLEIGIYFHKSTDAWRGENKINECFIDSCSDACIKILYTADSEITNSTFLGNGYTVSGTFGAWQFIGNHDYTLKGLNITTGFDCQILNNYFDHADQLPMIYIHSGNTRAFQICNNKFITGGTAISNPDNHGIIDYENTDYNGECNISNNICIGSQQNIAFINFLGNSRVIMSCTGNIIDKVCNKIFNNINKETINYSPNIEFKTSATVSSGTVNTNNIFIKNGQAHLQLDIINPPDTIELPFNAGGLYIVPALNQSDNRNIIVRTGLYSGGQLSNLNLLYTSITESMNNKRLIINGSINIYRGSENLAANINTSL